MTTGRTSKKEQDTARLHKGQELTKESDNNQQLSRLLNITNMADLKKIMFEKIMDSGEDDGLQYEVNLINYTFRSGKYETDKYNGICDRLVIQKSVQVYQP